MLTRNTFPESTLCVVILIFATELIPRIAPYIFRHTYCSEMEKTGMNPRTLQYLMGHSEISVTLNVYTHLGFDDAKEEIERLFAANQ